MVTTSFQQNVNQARLNVEKARQESLIREKKLNDLINQLKQRDRTDRSFVGTRRRQSSLLQNVNQAIRNRNRARLNRQSAKNTLSRFEAEQRKSLGRISKRQASRNKTKSRQERTITVGLGGARNTIETRQVTKRGRTRTTFTNRETGGQVSVGRKATFGSLSSTERKTLTRTSPVRKITKKQVTSTTRLNRLRSIAQVLPGVRLKGELLSSQEFSKRDLDIISNAASPAQAIKVVRELKKKEEKASQQKLQSFLKVTLAEVKTQQDVNNINKAIDKEVKRRQNKGLQLDLAVSQVVVEFKAIVKGIKNGTVSIQGTKNFGVNVILGFVGVFTAPIKASYNYGQNLVKRGLWSRTNNPLLRDIKRAGVVTSNGIYNTAKGLNYVRKHPNEAQIIVGVGAALLGVSLLSAFRKNPGKALGESLAIILPGTVVKGVVKVGKVSFKGLKVGNAAYLKAVSRVFEAEVKAIKSPTIIRKINLILDSSIPAIKKKEALYTILSSEAVKAIPRSEFIKIKLSKLTKLYKDSPAVLKAIEKIKKTKPLTKAQKLEAARIDKLTKLSGGKTVTKRLTLKQRLSKLKANRLKKKRIKAAKKKFKLEEKQKLKKEKAKEKKRKIAKKKFAAQEKLQPKKTRIVTRKTTFVVGEKTLTKRQQTALKAKRVKQTKNKILQEQKLKIKKQKLVAQRRASAKRRFAKRQKKADKSKPKKSEFEAFQVRKFGFGGRKGGQLKIGRQLQKESLQIQDRTNKVIQKSHVLGKGDIVRFRIGQITPINKQANKTLKSLKQAFKSKAISKQKYLSLNTKVLNSIARLRIAFSIISILRKTKSGVPPFRIFKQVIDTVKISKRLQKTDDVGELLKDKELKRIFDKAIAVIRIQIPAIKTPTRKVPKLIPKLKIPKKPTKKPPKKIRIPNLKGLKRSKSTRKGFIIRIKEGNVVLSKTSTALPQKRAINLMRHIVDNTAQASGETVRKGKTSIIDVKNTILARKFRPKRSKDPKVRIQVEKRKFRIDTKGEKTALRRKKRNNPRRKTVKRRKTSRKSTKRKK